eukprot:143671-Rhodomonas_salina.1
MHAAASTCMTHASHARSASWSTSPLPPSASPLPPSRSRSGPLSPDPLPLYTVFSHPPTQSPLPPYAISATPLRNLRYLPTQSPLPPYPSLPPYIISCYLATRVLRCAGS